MKEHKITEKEIKDHRMSHNFKILLLKLEQIRQFYKIIYAINND